ncbi:MAG: hypothetical protein FWD12_06320, partial [Alphaproteobacteria bacterium]|nr:hypothetical protein [Alphaproteobacteria bacterium]
LTNNVSALAALANGIRPLRKVAMLEAERRHMLDMQLEGSGVTGLAGSVPALRIDNARAA